MSRLAFLAATLGAVALVVASLLLAASRPAGAQEPPDSQIEAQALQIERQLLCPQCTSKRLDICELPICTDMRREIREQLRAGRDPGDILVYFRSRYGQRVLAEIPKEGFNLVLYGWVGGSIAGVALLGGGYLHRVHRASRIRRAPAAPPGETDDWLDTFELPDETAPR